MSRLYAVAAQYALLTQLLHDLFHEERRAFGLLKNELLLEVAAASRHVPSSTSRNSSASALAKRRKPQLRVIRLLPPLMAILGTIVHQQQDLGRGHALTEHVRKPLRLAIDPVQVLKDQDQRLIETLPQEELLERLKGPSAPNLRVHLLQRRGLFFNPQQGKQIGQGVFQAAVEHQHFAADFLPPLPFIILRPGCRK